jgi:hypothetical protein
MKTVKATCALVWILGAYGCGGDDSSDGNAGSSGAAGAAGTAGEAGSAGEGGAASEAGSSGSGGSAGASGTSGEPSELEYEPCAVGTRAGQFSIELAPRFTGIDGDVYDGVDPTFVPEELARDGECTLYRSPSLFCDPSCGSADVCGPDGCVPAPRTQDVGVVTVTGLVDSPIEMMPRMAGNHYTNPGSLTHPGFEEGAEIALSAAGGDHSAFMLQGAGVAALEVPATPVAVETGMPVQITWTAPGVTNDAVEVVINLDIARHGGTPARIECHVPDTGSFEVPEALVTQLVDIGFSGFPAVDLIRRSADSATVDGIGCVELEVIAKARVEAMLPGITSCNSAEDCEEGQTCQEDLTCSE